MAIDPRRVTFLVTLKFLRNNLKMHRSPLKNLTISTKYASKLGYTTFGISRYIKETDLLKQSEKATIRFPTNFCNNRLYHCKTSVYGFNASLQKRRAEEALDPKSHGFEELPQQRAAQPNLHRFVDAYRKHGHKIANTNPVKPPKPIDNDEDLDPSDFVEADPNSGSAVERLSQAFPGAEIVEAE